MRSSGLSIQETFMAYAEIQGKSSGKTVMGSHCNFPSTLLPFMLMVVVCHATQSNEVNLKPTDNLDTVSIASSMYSLLVPIETIDLEGINMISANTITYGMYPRIRLLQVYMAKV